MKIAVNKMLGFLRTSRFLGMVGLLGVVVWTCCMAGGCRDKDASLPPAPPAGTADVLSAWRALTNAAEVTRMFGGTRVQHVAPGVVRMPVDFAARPARVTWDLKLPLDLRVRSGIQFDFYCSDLGQFASFSCYFKSGDGWYHGTFAPEESGAWQRVTVSKASCAVEGRPAGWENISTVRISGWRAAEGRAVCALANVAVQGGDPDVLVVYADSLAAKGGSEAKSYLTFGGTVSATLAAIGVESALVADTDLTTNLLAKAAAVVLPYNPSFPAEKAALLADYVARGRRLLVCYSLPPELGALLGVKTRGTVRPSDNGGASIGGFLKTGTGLAGQPDFAPQASWITRVVAPGPGVEVVAEWGTGKQESMGLPALVRTPRGLFMGHVWLGGVDGASARLMKAIVCDLAPGLKEKIAAHEAAFEAEQRRMLAWLEERPSKTGEFRAFWCHSARGLGGDRNWDESIRFLKKHGFNAILPNLCWGGVAFYKSDVLPVHVDVAVRGDAFDDCLAACRRQGVECHVWKVCWNMGAYTGKAFEETMVASNRVQVTFNGTKKTRWLCPSHPANRQLEIDAMLELAKKGPDGVHFDYIRYPDGGSCFCDGCRERFEATLGRKIVNWPADVRADDALAAAWRAFRVDNITKVVQGVATRVRKEAPKVKVSAAVFRNAQSDPREVGQDWSAWCRAGYLDFVCNMDYIESAAMFRSQVTQQKKVVGSAKLYPGIGLSVWPNDGTAGVRLARQIEVVRELGLDGFTVFNFDRRAERILPLMRLGVTKQD